MFYAHHDTEREAFAALCEFAGERELWLGAGPVPDNVLSYTREPDRTFFCCDSNGPVALIGFDRWSW